METFFRKYEFATKTSLKRLMDALVVPNAHIIVDLGELTKGRTSVDALWLDNIPEGWTQYELWDIEGNGTHTFLGHNFKEDTDDDTGT